VAKSKVVKLLVDTVCVRASDDTGWDRSVPNVTQRRSDR
jgi:hypothetical protein